jgi:hypothetical protein
MIYNTDMEEQITQQLRQNIPVDPQVAAQEPTEVSQGTPNIGVELETYKLLDHFEIPIQDRNNQTILEQLQYVIRMAKNATGGDLLDAITYIREAESKLGLRFKGDRLYHLYHWMRLDGESRAIEVEKLNHVG